MQNGEKENYTEDLSIDPTAPEPSVVEQSFEEMREVSKSSLGRANLREEMGEAEYESIVKEARAFIDRRFKTMIKMRDVRDLNVNPFLMLAMAPAYNIFSPFEAAEYFQNAKMPHGDSTAFGKFVEDRIFPIFGVVRSQEKALNPSLYSGIDAAIEVEGQRYLTTWKSGPWTMNQSHANEMAGTFPQIHAETGLPIILGIFYGRIPQLNNKPALVREKTGDYFHVLVGSELWEFVTGVKDAHFKVLSAIREAQSRFAFDHGGKTFYEHMIEGRLALSDSFRKEFGLTGADDDMWELIFKNSF